MTWVGFILLTSILLYAGYSQAQEAPRLSVSPGAVSVELVERSQIVDTKIIIDNTSSEPITLGATLKSVDNESTGNLLASSNLQEPLKSVLSISQPTITVPARSSSVIVLTTQNAEALGPGGHYAALLLVQASEGEASITIQPTINISLYILKRGGEVADIKIVDQKIERSFWGLPIETSVIFKNEGNIRLTPRGSLTVRSLDGNSVYAKGVANQGSINIAPQNSFQASFSIEEIASLPKIPTRLKYITEYRADTVADSRYSESYGWYVPPLFVVISVIVVAGTTIVSYAFTRKMLKIKRSNSAERKNNQGKKHKARTIIDVVHVQSEE